MRVYPAQRQLGTLHETCGRTSDVAKSMQLYNCLTAIQGSYVRDAIKTLEVPSPEEKRAAWGNIVVLVVEDDMVNQKLASHILKKFGCHVDVASNGEEAIKAIEHTAYDCIFMDSRMPLMDGFATTALIRQREAGTDSHMPIIAMTADAMAGDRDKCLAAGMDDYVSKPMQTTDYIAMLQKWTPWVSQAPDPDVSETQPE